MITFRGVFECVFQGIAVTAVQDLFEVTADSDEVLALLELALSQTTDLGDAQEEVLRIAVQKSTSTSGSGGAAVTPVAVHANPSVFGGTAERNNTSQAAAPALLSEYGWNIRVPFEKIWTPETYVWVPPSGRLLVSLLAAPTDSITMSGTLKFGVL